MTMTHEVWLHLVPVHARAGVPRGRSGAGALEGGSGVGSAGPTLLPRPGTGQGRKKGVKDTVLLIPSASPGVRENADVLHR